MGSVCSTDVDSGLARGLLGIAWWDSHDGARRRRAVWLALRPDRLQPGTANAG